MRKTDVLDVAARKLAPYMLLFGLYLVTYGDVSPGGGFQGGVVIASGVILLAMAKGPGAAAEYFPPAGLTLAEMLGFGLILAAARAGLLVGAGFLADIIGRPGVLLSVTRAPFALVMNILIGLKVGAGVSLICLSLFTESGP